ncbi:MAG: FHA domain-containing protein [Anaerolineae bacterium]
MPYLRVVRGPEPGRMFELSGDVITIGRGRKNTIIIHDNEISREHCRLVKVLFDYEISDLNSTNGTFLNGRPVGEASSPLFDKNIIELGDSIVLEYVAALAETSAEDLTTAPSPAPAPSPPEVVSASDAQPPEAPAEPELPPSAAPSLPTNFYLVIRRRSQFMPEVYLLDSPLVDVGRHLDNAICLTESQVSRFHMRLNRINDSYTLEDLGSMNGTFVNGVRVEKPVTLASGDYITIGHMVEMWFTHNLETLRMVPNTPQQAEQRPSTGELAEAKAAAPEATTVKTPAEPLPQTTLLDPSALAALSISTQEPDPTTEEAEATTETTEHIPAQDLPAASVNATPSEVSLFVSSKASTSSAVRGLLNAAETLLPAAEHSAPEVNVNKEIANAVKSTEETPDVSVPPSEAKPDTPSEQ